LFIKKLVRHYISYEHKCRRKGSSFWKITPRGHENKKLVTIRKKVCLFPFIIINQILSFNLASSQLTPGSIISETDRNIPPAFDRVLEPKTNEIHF
jgi:hypothetical protein